jgi:hypothetical protein
MGLRGFHLFFILVSALFAGWLGWFLYGQGQATGLAGYHISAGISAAVALGLLAYGVSFWRKMKRLHIA